MYEWVLCTSPSGCAYGRCRKTTPIMSAFVCTCVCMCLCVLHPSLLVSSPQWWSSFTTFPSIFPSMSLLVGLSCLNICPISRALLHFVLENLSLLQLDVYKRQDLLMVSTVWYSGKQETNYQL